MDNAPGPTAPAQEFEGNRIDADAALSCLVGHKFALTRLTAPSHAPGMDSNNCVSAVSPGRPAPRGWAIAIAALVIAGLSCGNSEGAVVEPAKAALDASETGAPAPDDTGSDLAPEAENSDLSGKVDVDGGPDIPGGGPNADASDGSTPDAPNDGSPQEIVQPQCQSSADCPASKPYCDQTSSVCAACVIGGHCQGAGARCTNHACQPAVLCSNDKACLAVGSVCDKSAGYCVDCLNDAACQAGQTCQANSCLNPPKSCASAKDCPQSDQVCLAGHCVACSADGDCLASQWCSKNFCLPDACTAGAAKCADGHTVKSCAANGSEWTTTACPASHICDNGQCVAMACAPGDLRCSALKAEKCAPNGLTWLPEADCGSAGQACLNGACVATVCMAGSKKCAAGGWAVCSGDLLGWSEPTPCPLQSTCADGVCLPWDCTPSSQACVGQTAVNCSADGLTKQQLDCGQSGEVCESGSCKATFCKIGTLQCQGKQLAQCLAPGNEWTAVSCDDGQLCTQDDCNAANSACTHAKVNCDDGNSCTQEQCDPANGQCATANLSGPCGSNDKCDLSKCQKGTCVAAVGGFVSLAGTTTAGLMDGKGPLASFKGTGGLAFAPDGTLWVTEYSANKIRKIAPDGTVTTVAGVGGESGFLDGPATQARFHGPRGLAVGKTGLVYVTDQLNHRVRRISPAGVVSTVAGSTVGSANGPASLAQFYQPVGIAIDATNNLYVADWGNQRIRRISPDGQVSTVAGSGSNGYLDGPALEAKFSGPQWLAVESSGDLLIGDAGGCRIRRLNVAKSVVSTLAGAGQGSQDGPYSSAAFHFPGPIVLAPDGLIAFDTGSKRLRKVAGGSVTTIAGLGTDPQDGPIASSLLGDVSGMALDANGRLFLAEGTRIRFISATSLHCDDGSPCTAEACDPGTAGCKVTPAPAGSSCSDGNACTATDQCDSKGKCSGAAKVCDDGNPCTEDLCLPSSGSCEFGHWQVSCSDGDACTPADLCIAGKCETGVAALSTWAGQTTAGLIDGIGSQAAFGEIRAALWLANGSALVLDSTNHAIRQIKPDGSVSTYCGGNGLGYADGACGQAKFASPSGFAADSLGNLYVADTANHMIRKISSAGNVSTLAGSGASGYKDGQGNSAAFKSPTALALAPDGALTVADQGNFRLRRIAMDGMVSTVAGAGVAGKQDGAASSATFSSAVAGLAYDATGRLWIADSGNFAIRRIDSGKLVVTLVSGAGVPQNGPAAAAKFGYPSQLAVSPTGMVYIADTTAFQLRSLSTAGQVGTVIGTTVGFADGPATQAKLSAPRAIALGPQGKLLIGDGYRVRVVALPNIDCDDGQPCTADSCDKGSGSCSSAPIGDGGPCVDADLCTVGTTCGQGVCGAGEATTCNDNNACTDDSCVPATGCVFAANAGPGCCVPTVWSNSFDSSDLKGLSLNNSAGAGKGWQINLAPPGGIAKTPPGVLWYGNPATGNYDMGTTSGSAITAPIALTGGPPYKLNCSLLMDTEIVGKGSYDDLYVNLIVGGQKIAVWDKGAGITANLWYAVDVDLTSYAGKSVQIEFSFNTKDSYGNQGKGVFIDNLAITRGCK